MSKNFFVINRRVKVTTLPVSVFKKLLFFKSLPVCVVQSNPVEPSHLRNYSLNLCVILYTFLLIHLSLNLPMRHIIFTYKCSVFAYTKLQFSRKKYYIAVTSKLNKGFYRQMLSIFYKLYLRDWRSRSTIINLSNRSFLIHDNLWIWLVKLRHTCPGSSIGGCWTTKLIKLRFVLRSDEVFL